MACAAAAVGLAEEGEEGLELLSEDGGGWVEGRGSGEECISIRRT